MIDYTTPQTQQAGRCGRGRSLPESLSVIVLRDSPTDQHFAAHPQQLFSRLPESAALRIDNPYILRDHLVCAAEEAPLQSLDSGSFSEAELWGERGYCAAVEHLLGFPGGMSMPCAGERGDYEHVYCVHVD